MMDDDQRKRLHNQAVANFKSATSVDADEHYRQQAEDLATQNAGLIGALAGLVVAFVGLLVWEVLRR